MNKAIKWIMVISGALTFTMIYAAIAPQAALRSNFGGTLEGPIAEIVVRNWGALIALIGAMLIYGAFEPQGRNLALVAAGVSKLAFMGIVLGFGQRFLEERIAIAMGVDLAMVALFATFLIGMRRIGRPRASRPTAPSMSQQAMPPTPNANSTARIPAPRPPMVKSP